MIKKIVLLFLLPVFFIPAYSQRSSDKGISVSPGLNIPMGDLSSTHSFGIATDCSPSRHTFGLVKNKNIAFTYNGGLAYYFGKKETVSGHPYKYPGYFFIHAYAELLYVPVKKLTASLLAGPALGIYNGKTRFNVGSRLEANFFINTSFMIGPILNMMLEPGTTSLWSAGIRGTIVL